MSRLLAALLVYAFVPAGWAAAASYSADPAASRIEFMATQAGAEFKGVFKTFNANVQFAPDAPAASKIDVSIDLKTVDTKDASRDSMIRDKDFFDVKRYPSARYVTKSISKTPKGFAAVGSLTLRGVTKDVPITFTFAPAGGGAKLTGTAQINRLDFGVGQGDWKNTDWVGNPVKISFSLTLRSRTQ